MKTLCLNVHLTDFYIALCLAFGIIVLLCIDSSAVNLIGMRCLKVPEPINGRTDSSRSTANQNIEYREYTI